MARIIMWDGGPISEAGAYSGIPIERYHRADFLPGPSISSSGLKLIDLNTPAHYWAQSHLNPDRIEREETPALRLGSAVHTLFLGEAGFRDRFAVQPATYIDQKTGEEKPWNGNANACKAWRAEQFSRSILTADQFATIRRMAASLASYPAVASSGILSGDVEASLFWQDPKHGVWLRNRPDVMPREGWIVDLKTIRSADDRSIRYAIEDYGYDIQLGLAAEAARHVLGIEAATFVLVFIETAPPYAPRIVELSADKIVVGRGKARRAIERFASCLASGEWPAYEPTEILIDASERDRTILTTDLARYTEDLT